MSNLSHQIVQAVAGGVSHRKAAAMFGVSVRQVQKAIDPARRAELDRYYSQYYYATRPEYREKARERARAWREKNRDKINARLRAKYNPAQRRAALERHIAKYGPQYYKRWPSNSGVGA